MKLVIDGKEYEIKEIGYMDAIEVEELRSNSMKNAVRKLISLATNLTVEEVDKLTLKQGIEIQKAINEVNSLGDFQKTAQELKLN